MVAGLSERLGAVRIRDADVADDDAVLLLWRELMEVHKSCDPRFDLADDADRAFASYLDALRIRPDYRIRVAERDGAVLGFCVACVLPNSPIYRRRSIGYINDICVARAARGHGVGTMLARDAVSWLNGRGAASIEVYVAHGNARAQRFWRRLGGRDYLNRLGIDLDAFFQGSSGPEGRGE